MSDSHHPTPQIDLQAGGPHPFHLVAPSIWPLASSFAAGLMFLGAVLYMHDVKTGDIHWGAKGLIAGFVAVLYCMYGWWREVVNESVVQKAHTPVVRTGLRYGMALFITSEVMFFAAFFWAFFYGALFPTEAIGGIWPPKGIETFDPLHLPFLMTLILLLSGCTVTWAHHAVMEGDNKTAAKALLISVLLGIGFSCLQMYEYSHATFGIKDTIYAATFYIATGFHGLHVIIGTIFLFVCWRRAAANHFTPTAHVGFEAAAWYWHFVDVVWLFLFVSIYWWGGGH